MRTVKFFALLGFVALAALPNLATAQVDVTLNPIELLVGDISAGADFAITENFSIEAGVGISAGKVGDDFKWSSIPVTAVGKYYFNPRRGSDGFYADAFLRYVNRSYNAEANSNNADAKWSRLGLGFGIGFKAVSAKGIVFDIGVGAGRAIIDDLTYEENGEEYSFDWPNLMLYGKLGVGYRFGGK